MTRGCDRIVRRRMIALRRSVWKNKRRIKRKKKGNYNEPNVRSKKSVWNARKNVNELNAIKSVWNVKRNMKGLNEKRKELFSLKRLDLRKKSKCSEYV